MRIMLPDHVAVGFKAWAAAEPEVISKIPLMAALLQAIADAEADLRAVDRDAIVNRAKDLFCDDDVEIDEDATFSRGEDGVWVQAWVHVHRRELGLDEDEDDDDDEDGGDG